MKKLIDTKLVGKLMRETAKECGMTRLYSASDNCYWEADRLERLFPKTHWSDYRRVTRRYDVVTDNFIELLEAKVKAEGFNIVDCNPKIKMALGIVRKRVDNVDVYKDPGYIEQWEIAKKLYDKLANSYIERRPHLQSFDSDYFKLEPEHMHYFMGPATDFDWKSKECDEIYKAQDELMEIWYKIEPKVSYRYEYVVEKSKYDSTTIGDTYIRLTARMDRKEK